MNLCQNLSMRDCGTGRAPEVFQGKIIPLCERPQAPVQVPRYETPEDVVHVDEEQEAKEVDPRELELEKFPDEDLIQLARKYHMAVAIADDGSLADRVLVVSSLAKVGAVCT